MKNVLDYKSYARLCNVKDVCEKRIEKNLYASQIKLYFSNWLISYFADNHLSIYEKVMNVQLHLQSDLE